MFYRVFYAFITLFTLSYSALLLGPACRAAAGAAAFTAADAAAAL